MIRIIELFFSFVKIFIVKRQRYLLIEYFSSQHRLKSPMGRQINFGAWTIFCLHRIKQGSRQRAWQHVGYRSYPMLCTYSTGGIWDVEYHTPYGMYIRESSVRGGTAKTHPVLQMLINQALFEKWRSRLIWWIINQYLWRTPKFKFKNNLIVIHGG